MKTQKPHPSAKAFISFALIAVLGIILFTFSDNKASAFTRELTLTTFMGGGTVTGPGINCGSDCNEQIEDGTNVTLTAVPDSGRSFIKWITYYVSCNNGISNPTCEFPMNSPASLQAVWGYPEYYVTIEKQGDGSGTVTGGGTYHFGDTVNLQATAASGSTFEGWSDGSCGAGKGGGLNPSASCTVTISTAHVQTYTEKPKFTKMQSSTPTPPPTSTGNSSHSSSSQPSTQTTETTPSASEDQTALPITEFKLNNDSLSSETPPTVSQNQVILSGKTTPLATVNLYIHSDPRLVTTTADDQGFWSVTVSDLETGEHSIEAEVVDPTTGKTSERKQVAAFSVSSAAAQTTAVAASSIQATLSRWLWMALAALMLVGFGIGGWLYWKRYKASHNANNQPPTPPSNPN